MARTNVSTLPTLKIDLQDHPIIKYDIFEVNATFPPRGTKIGIVDQYCEHHNMSYISHSTNNRPWNHDFIAINRTNLWMIIIGRKQPKKPQQVMEGIPSQYLTGK